MISRRFVRVSAVAFATMGALGASSIARAQSAETSCATDTDCAHGFICQTLGTACPAIACDPNDPSCVQPVCDPQVVKQCEPGPCATDSDCATGMVCYAQSTESCPPVVEPACAPGTKCEVAAVDAGACTTTTTNLCVPQYDVPCKVSADCGPGFTCAPDSVTECSGGGSASSGGSSGAVGATTTESAGPTVAEDGGAPASTCTTTTLSTSSCQLDPITCTTASDCPSAMWTCAPTAVSNNVACPELALPVDGGAAPYTGCGTEPAAPMQCVPPYAAFSGSGATGALSVGNAAAGDAGVGAAPTASGLAGTGTTPPEATAGCQLGAGRAAGTGGGASVFALFGLIGLMRRRRH